MTAEELRERLDEQGWRCAYPCGDDGVTGGRIHEGDKLAKSCYEGHGLVHLDCARVGVAPKWEPR